MTDPLTIRAVANELLHAAAAVAPGVIAQVAGCTIGAVCRALGDDSRFERVAGEGCWWWRLSALPQLGVKRRTPSTSELEQTTAARRAYAARERIRSALDLHPGGATASRIAELTGMPAHEVLEMLRGLEALGEISTYHLSTFQFWKASAA